MAYATGKRLMVILDGGHESVFTHLKVMECFASQEAALEHLRRC